MLAISAGMFKMASIALRKVCVGLQRVIDAKGEEQIDVTHMTLLGHGQRRYLREDCEGSRDTKVSQNFAVLDTRDEGPPVYYLFPVNGWWSDDIGFLKTFLFEKFFRREPTPPPDADLIAIEGFGGFRPAQLADPTHAASRQLAWPASPESIKVCALHHGQSSTAQYPHVHFLAGHAVLSARRARVHPFPQDAVAEQPRTSTGARAVGESVPRQVRDRNISCTPLGKHMKHTNNALCRDVQRARDRTAASLAATPAKSPPASPQEPHNHDTDSGSAFKK